MLIELIGNVSFDLQKFMDTNSNAHMKQYHIAEESTFQVIGIILTMGI